MENQNQPSCTIPGDILDDLASRFIINVPEEERKNIVRICFQIELAHWFYLDFYCNKQNNNRKCTIKEFVYNMFKHIPFLNKYCKSAEDTYEMWRQYKLSVPTFGAIILDQDLTHVLLVQGFYSKCSWGFPKGKINEGEEWSRCAVREVLEETGFDISPYLNDQEYLEHTYNDQLSRLYIIPGVPRDTGFLPTTRCEIKSIQWFPIDQLPCTKKDTTSKDKMGLNSNSFFMIIPFMRRIRLWIETKRAAMATNSKPILNGRKQRLTSQGDSDTRANQRKSAQKEQHENKPKQSPPLQMQQNGRTNRKSNGKRLSPRCSPPSSNGVQQNVSCNGVQQNVSSNGVQQNVSSNGVQQNVASTNKCPLKFDKNGTPIITAPSWTNFHFDRRALIQQLAS